MLQWFRADGCPRLDGEALDEDAVDAVLPHPLEVAQDGLAVVGTEDVRDRPVGVAEGRVEQFVRRPSSAHVRPQVDVATAGPELPPPGVVRPPLAGPVPGRREPPLVAAHHLAGQGGAVGPGPTLAGVRLQDGRRLLARGPLVGRRRGVQGASRAMRRNMTRPKTPGCEWTRSVAPCPRYTLPGVPRLGSSATCGWHQLITMVQSS